MQNIYLNAVKRFEGYADQARWDYSQYSVGYGTKALHPGEKIDRAEAERRLKAEISEADRLVSKFAPSLPEGTHAALTSLTFNAGTKWMSSGLGAAVRSGDIETAKDLFLQYNKAGGRVLPGLVARRIEEASWIVPSTHGDEGQIRVATGTPPPSGEEVALKTGSSTLVNTVGDAIPPDLGPTRSTWAAAVNQSADLSNWQHLIALLDASHAEKETNHVESSTQKDGAPKPSDQETGWSSIAVVTHASSDEPHENWATNVVTEAMDRRIA